MIAGRDFDPRRTIVFATKLGKIKQTRLDAFKRPNVRGIRAIALNDGDELVEARIADGDAEVILASAGGSANRFSLGEVRAMGRTAAGGRGMRRRNDGRAARGVRIQRLSEGDKVTAVVRLVRPTEEETAVGDTTPSDQKAES